MSSNQLMLIIHNFFKVLLAIISVATVTFFKILPFKNMILQSLICKMIYKQIVSDFLLILNINASCFFCHLQSLRLAIKKNDRVVIGVMRETVKKTKAIDCLQSTCFFIHLTKSKTKMSHTDTYLEDDYVLFQTTILPKVNSFYETNHRHLMLACQHVKAHTRSQARQPNHWPLNLDLE